MLQRAPGKGDEQTVSVHATAWGWLGISASPEGVRRIILPKKRKRPVEREIARTGRAVQVTGRAGSRASAQLRKAARLLERYFSGKHALFDLPLDLRYYTPFQRAVWRAASKIPRGETRSYGWIAKQIGRPKAARAVGQALGSNPVPVLVPCHRVVGSAGKLGGFSGGLGMKKKLLELEQAGGSEGKKERRGRQSRRAGS